MTSIIGVRFKKVGKVYYFDPQGLTVKPGQWVIVETARGIECGECERVCPMGLPLMTLMHKQIKDINELFGPYEGGGLSLDAPDALRTFKTDDIEEFM